MKPRTALTGVPSSLVISGTPKKARKYIEAESRSINGAAISGRIWSRPHPFRAPD